MKKPKSRMSRDKRLAKLKGAEAQLKAVILPNGPRQPSIAEKWHGLMSDAEYLCPKKRIRRTEIEAVMALIEAAKLKEDAAQKEAEPSRKKAILKEAKSLRKDARLKWAEAYNRDADSVERDMVLKTRRRKEVAFVEDGQPVTRWQDYSKRLNEASSQLADECVDAMLFWQPDFFRKLAADMERVASEGGYQIDLERVILLRAAVESKGAPVNMTAVAREIVRRGDRRDVESVRVSLCRIARRLGIKATQGRPKTAKP